MNDEQKVILAIYIPTLILIITYWITTVVSGARSTILIKYGPLDFELIWIAVIWLSAVTCIAALEWVLFKD